MTQKVFLGEYVEKLDKAAVKDKKRMVGCAMGIMRFAAELSKDSANADHVALLRENVIDMRFENPLRLVSDRYFETMARHRDPAIEKKLSTLMAQGSLYEDQYPLDQDFIRELEKQPSEQEPDGCITLGEPL